MKKFSFKLETLLQYRQTLEEQERTKLSRIHLRFQSELDQLRKLQSKHQETLAELAKKMAETSDQREMTWFYLFLGRLRGEMEESGKRIEQLERDLIAQKKVLVEASKDKKVLDTLKTKKEKKFSATQRKEEQKAVEEIVVTRFGRKEH